MTDRSAEDPLEAFGLDGEADTTDGEEPWLGELARALEEPELGSVGPYELLDEAGRGGQGTVFKARQTSTGRLIALKRLIDGPFARPAARRRFEREVEVVARLSHPGVISVLGLDEVDDVPILAMPWVEGQRIDTWAAGLTGPGRTERVLRCVLRLCEALEHAHGHGVLHLDLKPSNILVCEGDRPVVLDFGLAQLDGGDRSLSRTDVLVGTLEYASPEQLRGSRASLDVRSDVYSLVVVLYQLLCGEPPFDFDGGVGAALAAQEAERYPRPSPRLRSVPRLLGRELDAIVAKGLAVDRSHRYSNVAALAADLNAALSGGAVVAHPPSAPYRALVFARANRTLVTSVALAFVALAAFAIQARVQANRLELEREREAAARAAADAAELEARNEAVSRNIMLGFLFNWVFEGPFVVNPETSMTVAEVFDSASKQADRYFAQLPDVEAEFRSRIGGAWKRIGDFDRARAEIERGLEVVGDDARVRAQLHYELGTLAQAQVDFPTAREHFEQALEGVESMYLEDRLQLYLEFATLLAAAGEFEGSLELYRTALAYAEQERERVIVIDSRRGIGLVYARMRYYDAAREMYVAALEEARALETPSLVLESKLVASLADLEQADGHLEQSERYSRESLEIELERYGEGHPLTVAARGDLGDVLTDLGRLEEGRVQLELAVAGSEALREPGSLITAIHRTRLCENQLLRGELEGLADAIEEDHRRFSSNLGPESTWALQTENLALALAYLEGRLDKHQALRAEIRERTGPDKAVRVLADYDRTRALVLWSNGRQAEGRALLEEAYAAIEANTDDLESALHMRTRKDAFPLSAWGAEDAVQWLDELRLRVTSDS
ncbi:MAG: serine/threonine-protein kinase [Planctomycetota bacterium]